MVRFLVRVLVILFALVLVCSGISLLASGERVMAYGNFAIAAAILIYRHRHMRKNWRDDPATDHQKSFAKDLGIRHPKRITKGELSDLIDQQLHERNFRHGSPRGE